MKELKNQIKSALIQMKKNFDNETISELTELRLEIIEKIRQLYEPEITIDEIVNKLKKTSIF